MIVQSVHDADLGAVREVDLGRVDLPQVIGDLPLKALGGLRSLAGLVDHQVVAPEHLVDGGDGRRVDPCLAELGPDPPGSPPGMVLSHATDLHLQVDVDLPGRACGPPGSRFQAAGSFFLVAALVLVEGLPGDPASPAHLCYRLTGPLRLEQHLQPELRHGHHPQAHAHLPVVLGKAGPVWVVSGMCPEHLSGMCPERSVRHVSGHHTFECPRVVMQVLCGGDRAFVDHDHSASLTTALSALRAAC